MIKAYFSNLFWLTATFLLAPLFYFLIAFRKKNDRLKILVIQTAKIGDLVCATPVFREIKKKFPASRLTVMVASQTKDVLKNNPRVDELVVFTDYQGLAGRLKLLSKLRKDKYDWAFNVVPGSFDNIISLWALVPNRATTAYEHSGDVAALTSIFSNYRLEYKRRTSIIKHFLDLLRFAGIEDFSMEKEMFIRPEEEKRAADFLDRSGLRSSDLIIGISPAAGMKMKEWDPVKFAKTADLLSEKLSAKVVFIGSSDNKTLIEKIMRMMQNKSVDASGFFKLNELPALLQKLKLFISVDSGPLHIADAAGIPLAIIAGPIDIPSQGPTRSRFKIIKKDIYCAPCLFAISDPKGCKEGHFRCLQEIAPEEVFEAAISLIKR